MTNGNLDACDKEKSQREWEKHKPPWVDELKSNIKSGKTTTSDSKSEKKSPLPGELIFRQEWVIKGCPTADAGLPEPFYDKVVESGPAPSKQINLRCTWSLPKGFSDL